MVRIGSDNATKLFKLNDKAGAAIAGRAFLPDSAGELRSVGYFIEEFRNSGISPTASVKEIALSLTAYLAQQFVDRAMESLKAEIEATIRAEGGSGLVFQTAEGSMQPYSYVDSQGQVRQDAGSIETVELIIAGADEDKVGRCYRTSVGNGITFESDTHRLGAMWIGQGDVISRILLGYDPIASKLEFVKTALAENRDSITAELGKLQYVVNWSTMTLQDAIDFNVLITRTTESIQRFSDGTYLSPGGVTGVGGEIGVAAILPDKGFTWIRKKRLTVEGMGDAAL